MNQEKLLKLLENKLDQFWDNMHDGCDYSDIKDHLKVLYYVLELMKEPNKTINCLQCNKDLNDDYVVFYKGYMCSDCKEVYFN